MHDLSSLFTPRSVAVIGASSGPERIGERPLRYMVEAGFKGALYPVNVSGAAPQRKLVATGNEADVDVAYFGAVTGGLPASGATAAMTTSGGIGIHMDPVFGPMVMFGLGGTAVELCKDMAFASAPLTPARALCLDALVTLRGDAPAVAGTL